MLDCHCVDLATYDRVKRLLLNKTSLSDNSITHALARCALVTCVVDKAASVGLSLATSCSGVDMQRLATSTCSLCHACNIHCTSSLT